ncbi:MAG: mechanosensitive ion channel family protein [Flavobacteriaceae bacterium]
MDNPQKWVDAGWNFIMEYGPKVIGAIVIYIIGSWVIGRIRGVARRMMAKSEYDESLQKFLLNLLSWALKVLLIVIVISTLGVDVTTFAAVLAAAGLAIGMALQGSLANFAGGVLLLIFKPYKIGALIEAQGALGAAKEIEIFTTKMVTPDNKLTIIPNGPMANGNIVNYTAEGIIRVDTQVGIHYDDDPRKAKEVLLEMLKSNPKVLKDPAPSVDVLALGESSVDLAVRPFCKPEDYWDVYFHTVENTKYVLDGAGIEIPYPHSVEIEKKG